MLVSSKFLKIIVLDISHLLSGLSFTHLECILQCGKPCESTDSIDNMTQGAWEKLKLKSLNWKGYDRFGNVYDNVDWELEPHGKHLHASCRLDISSSD